MYAKNIRLAAPSSSPLDFREAKYFTRGTETIVHIA